MCWPRAHSLLPAVLESAEDCMASTEAALRGESSSPPTCRITSPCLPRTSWEGIGLIRTASEHCLFPGLARSLPGGHRAVHHPSMSALSLRSVGGSSQPGPKPWFRLYISRSQGFYLALAACAFVLSLGAHLASLRAPNGNYITLHDRIQIFVQGSTPFGRFPGFDVHGVHWQSLCLPEKASPEL